MLLSPWLTPLAKDRVSLTHPVNPDRRPWARAALCYRIMQGQGNRSAVIDVPGRCVLPEGVLWKVWKQTHRVKAGCSPGGGWGRGNGPGMCPAAGACWAVGTWVPGNYSCVQLKVKPCSYRNWREGDGRGTCPGGPVPWAGSGDFSSLSQPTCKMGYFCSAAGCLSRLSRLSRIWCVTCL